MPESTDPNSKYVLIVRQSEPLKIDGKGVRLWRASLMQKYCQMLGLNAVYLTSTFNHYNKKQRALDRSCLSEEEKKTFIFLRTPGYKSNISVSRFVDHMIFGLKTGIFIVRERRKIQAIFTSHPTVEGAFMSVILGKVFGIRVIVDVRDLWPDLFYDIVGKALISKMLLRLALFPYTLMTVATFSIAQNISAPTKSYLEWAESKSLFKKKKTLIKLPFAYPSGKGKKNVRPSFLRKYQGYKVCVFIGTLNENMFDFSPIVSAVRKFHKQVVFVIAGDGSGRNALEERFCNDKNVVFPGWLSKDELTNLMQFSDFALAPYIPVNNFKMHIPNKIIEYLSGHLPILYSVPGEMDVLLKKCGLRYDPSCPNYKASFQAIVGKVLNNEYLLMEMSTNAAEVFESEFRAEAVYKEFIISHLYPSAKIGS